MNSGTRGYFLVARGLFDHPRFKPQGPFSSLEAWMWLIESAAHTPRDVSATNGRHRVTIHLEPGQCTFSVRFLAEAWQWSDKRVQRFLSALTLDQSVTTQTTTGQTVITLCNWARYQRRLADATTQSETQTTTQPTTKKKELKELNDGGTRAIAKKPNLEKEDAAAKRDVIALGLAFLQAAGFTDYSDAPMNWYGLPARAALWREAGYSTDMIVAETKIIARQGGDTKSLNYFDRVFATAQTRAMQPLPVSTPRLAGTARGIGSNRRPNVSDALAELLAEARAAEQAGQGAGAESSRPVLRLLPPR
jgi:hypothetical protein